MRSMGKVLVSLGFLLAVGLGLGTFLTLKEPDYLAKVGEQKITQSDIDRALETKMQILPELKEKIGNKGTCLKNPSCKKFYHKVELSSLEELLFLFWVEGEAARRGIVVLSESVNEERLLGHKSMPISERRRWNRKELLAGKIDLAFKKQPIRVGKTELQREYQLQKPAFVAPEKRAFRVIAAPTKSTLVEAKSALLDGEDFESVARKFSQDPTTWPTGEIELTTEKEITRQIISKKLAAKYFSIPTSGLVGPFLIENFYYLVEVTKVEPAKNISFVKAAPFLKKRIIQVKKNNLSQQNLAKYHKYWKARTVCHERFRSQSPLCKEGPKFDDL